MRVVIDIPDHLLVRVKNLTIERKTTFRAVVIDALERTLKETPRDFRLRDASVGSMAPKGKEISSLAINSLIDEQRSHPFSIG